ncbi:hypothetical protein [Alienimonas chondri]|uniref:Uncharacterized protein n=1 Tax=Alienimonas chondri TaxID=2681879 RepID=A0ABX1VBY4_9PLAN|nr:hypothetical protein [Alienimonas chondri]NNJ24812.1 hypothetical protein [Alienimonas chondri]
MDWITLTRTEIEADALPPVCMECGEDAPVRVNRTFGVTPFWLEPFSALAELFIGLLPGLIVGGAAVGLFRRETRISCPFCERHANHWARPYHRALLWSLLCGLAGAGLGWLGAGWFGAEGAAVVWAILGTSFGAGSLAALAGLATGASCIDASAANRAGVRLQHVSPRFVDAMNRVRDAGPPTRLGDEPSVLAERGKRALDVAVSSVSGLLTRGSGNPDAGR